MNLLHMIVNLNRVKPFVRCCITGHEHFTCPIVLESGLKCRTSGLCRTSRYLEICNAIVFIIPCEE